MMANARELLAVRPRRRPPLPSAINSWALKTINLHSVHEAQQIPNSNLVHLRKALIGARHVSGEPEEDPGDPHAKCMPQPAVNPNPSPFPCLAAGTPAKFAPPASSSRPASYDGGPPDARRAPSRAPSPASPQDSLNPFGQLGNAQQRQTPRGHYPGPSVGDHPPPEPPRSATIQTCRLSDPPFSSHLMPPPSSRPPMPLEQQQLQQQRRRLQQQEPATAHLSQSPYRCPATAAVPPSTRTRALGFSTAKADWDTDLLAGLDRKFEVDPTTTATAAELGISQSSYPDRTGNNIHTGRAAQPHGQDRSNNQTHVNDHNHQHLHQRQEQHRKSDVAGGYGPSDTVVAVAMEMARLKQQLTEGQQHVGNNPLSSGIYCPSEAPMTSPMYSGDANDGGGGSGSGRWWEDLDEVLVQGGSASKPQPESVAAQHRQRRSTSGPRQAVLTPTGGCVLPPQLPTGAVWKAARPTTATATAAAVSPFAPAPVSVSAAAVKQQQMDNGTEHAAAAVPESGQNQTHKQQEQEQQQQQQQQQQQEQQQLVKAPFQMGQVPGAVARQKRSRDVGGGNDAGEDDAGAAGSGAVRAPVGRAGGRKKWGRANEADGRAAEALLSQLLPLCEVMEGLGGDALGEGAGGGGGGEILRDASDQQVASELVRQISSSRLLLVGLLVAVCEGPVYQYASNMQCVSKPQRDVLLKARRLLGKDPAATAALSAQGAEKTADVRGSNSISITGSKTISSGSRLGSGVLASEHLERCVAFCVMCLDECMYDDLLCSGSDGSGGGGSGGGGGPVGSAPDTADVRPPNAPRSVRGLEARAVKVPMYLLRTMAWPPVVGSSQGLANSGRQQHHALPRATLLSLLDEMLVRAPCLTLCCNAKVFLREAMSLGWRSPPPQKLRIMDPCILSWMEAPQLAQRDEKEIEGYTLDALCPRYGIMLQLPQSLGGAGGAGPSSEGGPLALARIRRGLWATGQLFEAVGGRAKSWLRPQAVKVEMQVAWVLARMEALGIAVDTADLGRKAAGVRQRMESLSSTASALLGGRPLNLGSSAQLAVALYENLKLPPPVPQGQRDAGAGPGKDRNGRTRIHHSTDEAALKQISHLHPLPALVLQYRALQNVLSKWLEPEWLPPLLARSGCAAPRLSCCWNQTATATGRLSSSGPNLQAVTKYEVVVQLDDANAAVPGGGSGGTVRSTDMAGVDQAEGPTGRQSLVVAARNAFVVPSGRLLVAADYSQIELRLLAHLSGDLRLQELLRSSKEGTAGGPDAFRLIAAAWLRPGTDPSDISSRDREQVKRVVYGIIYGMTAQGLAQQLSEYGVGLEEATALRASFLRYFAGVQAFITSSLHHARRHGYITTGLLGRRRPIAGVNSSDARVRAEAERKVVNSIVQGTAADLVKCAMCMWAEFNHPDCHQRLAPQQAAATRGAAATGKPLPVMAAATAAGGAPASATATAEVPPTLDAELLAQIHDELVFEVDERPETVRKLVVAVRRIMCGVVMLEVPLLIKVAAGHSWGGLKELPSGFGEEDNL